MLVVICGLFTLFPERYRSATTVAPTDPSSLGLGGALGQLGAINTVFGSQTAIEVSLRVARGVEVRDIVIKRLDLVRKMRLGDPLDAHRWLVRNIDIRALRGGIIQFEYKGQDPAFGRTLVGGFAEATRAKLGEISREQTAYKRQVLIDLVNEAFDRRARAQTAYDTFRLRTRYSEPSSAIAAIGDRIPDIQAQIKGKEVALNAARQFATDDNMSVRQILAELDALRRQLQEAETTNPTETNSVGRVVKESTEVQNLQRELGIARSLYDSYTRFLEGTSVEDLTSTANLRVLEPPYIDTDRQYNLIAFAIGLMFLMTGLAVEFYQMRPPVGSGLVDQS